MLAYLTGKTSPVVVTKDMITSINNQTKKIPTKEMDITASGPSGPKDLRNSNPKDQKDSKDQKDPKDVYTMLIDSEDLMLKLRPYLKAMLAEYTLQPPVIKSSSILSSVKAQRMASYDISLTLEKIVFPLVIEFEHELYGCKYLEFSGGFNADKLSDPLATDEPGILPVTDPLDPLDKVDTVTGKLCVQNPKGTRYLNIMSVTLNQDTSSKLGKVFEKGTVFTDLKGLVSPLQIRGRVDVKL